MISVLGVYAVGSSVIDVAVLLGIGLLGLLIRRARVPLAPVMIAVVLGPLAETELRRALAVSEGDPSARVSSPFTIGLYSVLAIGLIASVVQHMRARRKNAESGGDADGTDDSTIDGGTPDASAGATLDATAFDSTVVDATGSHAARDGDRMPTVGVSPGRSAND